MSAKHPPSSRHPQTRRGAFSIRRLRYALGALALCGMALPACSAETGSQTDDHTEGALGFAPPIAYGQTVTGQVASPQIDIWALDVQAGDKFRLTNTVTGGDLSPDIVLFRGNVNDHISSDAHEVAEGSLRKDYATDRNGRYFIVVRGYQNQGAGSYSLSAECLGGPCAGEIPPPPVVELDDGDKVACVRQARECAVTKLPEYGGAVGSVRAKQIFDDCLGQATVDTWQSDVPASCATACAGVDDAFVCDSIVGMLPWLADRTPQCVDAFNGCIEDCSDAAGGDHPNNLYEGIEAVCVTGEVAFNGSCRDVSELAVCGGEWSEDSCEACYIGCHATIGAWYDDLDTICSDECDCSPSDDL